MIIAEVFPKDDYTLFVRAENGETGWFDVKPYLDAEAFSALKSGDEFGRTRNGGYFVEWECGADLSANTILARWWVVSAA
jgi:hypothetical protein